MREARVDDTARPEKREWVTPGVIVIGDGNILGGPLKTLSETFLPFVGYNS